MRSRSSSVAAALALAIALHVTGQVTQVAAFAQAAATTSADEKPVSVAGEVRNSVTLAPVERAHVSVRRFLNGKWNRYGVLTNGEGKFLIANLPAGAYAIFVDRTGFTDPTLSSAREMKLEPGAKKEDFKLKLTPTGEITGRVLDRDGVPMEGLMVRVESVAGQSLRMEITDDRGMFRIGALAPGKYRLIALPVRTLPSPAEIRTDGTAEVHYSPTYYPGALNATEATKVTVPAGGELAGLEIRMVSTPILRVSGRVSGFPPGAQNVSVSLSRWASISGVGTRVGPDGRFEIWRVDPGKYTLRGYYISSGAPMTSGPQEIEIGGADIENLAVQLMPPVDVRGVVAFEDDETRTFMQPPGAEKPQQCFVMVRDESSNSIANGQVQADGSFVVPRVQPGLYRLTIAPGSVYVKAIEFGQVHVESAQLDVRSGATGPLTIHVATASGVIAGVIRDEKVPAGGSPGGTDGTARTVVAIVEADAQKARPSYGTVKADGSYSFNAVTPGKYRIVAYQESDLLWANEDVEDIGEVIELRERDVVHKDLKLRVIGEVK